MFLSGGDIMKFVFQEKGCNSKICYLRLAGLGIIAGILTFFCSFGEINGKETLLGFSQK
jgi:hypothetical protein